MNLVQDFVGSMIELAMTIILMNLFSGQYLSRKARVLAVIIAMSGAIVMLDLVNVPFTELLNYILMVGALTVAVKRNLLYVLFELLFASAIILTIEYALTILFYKIQGTEALEFKSILLQLVITFAICAGLGYNGKLQLKFRRIYEQYREEICFVAATLFGFSVIELHLWRRNSEFVFGHSTVILLYTTIWLGLSIFLLKKLIENRKQRENITLHRQYRETTEVLLDSLYSEKHDFNKHLQAIKGICQCSEAQIATAEIEAYIDSIKRKDSEREQEVVLSHTGNAMIDALIYSKAKDAEKYNIRFAYLPTGDFPDFPCKQHELVQIIGNLLDNAFEYVHNLESAYRRVTISVKEVDGKKQIEVRNACFAEKNETIIIPQTTRFSTKEGRGHGYGLLNVRTIATKYHGCLNLFQEDDEFIAEVLF